MAATLRIVASRGVSAATFEEIGREAGYSRGLAAQRFGSKDGLLKAVVAYLHEWQDEALAQRHVADMNGLDALCAFVRIHCDMIGRSDEARAYYMLLASTVADLTGGTLAFAESHRVMKALIAGIVARGGAAGDIAEGADPDAVALTVGSALLGLNLQCLIDPSTDPAPVRDELIAALRARLTPQRKPKR